MVLILLKKHATIRGGSRVSYVSMDTVNIIGENGNKINIYYYYPVRKGQVMVGNYFNVCRLVG